MESSVKKHNPQIGNTTGRDLADLLRNDMIKEKGGWRPEINENTQDIYFLQVKEYKGYCGITIRAKPTKNQPGNGVLSCKEVPSTKWIDLKSYMLKNKNEFMKKRQKFLQSKIRTTYKENSISESNPSFFINVLLAFEIARRIEPKSGDYVSDDDTKKAIEIVFDPQTYDTSKISYEEMVSYINLRYDKE